MIAGLLRSLSWVFLASGLLMTCSLPASAGVKVVDSFERTAGLAAMASLRADDRRSVHERLAGRQLHLEAKLRERVEELRSVEHELDHLAGLFRDLMVRRDEATATLASQTDRVVALQRRIEAVLAELMQLNRKETVDRRRIAQLRAIAASYARPFAEARATLAASRAARQAFALEERELRTAGLDARARQLVLERQAAALADARRTGRLGLTEAVARELAARRSARSAQRRQERVAESRLLASLPDGVARLWIPSRLGRAVSLLEPATLTARAVLHRRSKRRAVLFGDPAVSAIGGLSGIGRIMPVAGTVVGYFGQGPNGLLDRGLTIAVDGRRLVRAPRGGRVVFAGPFMSFGLLLIIEHGDEYHSLLSGLSRLVVPVGAVVRTGQMVGTLEPDPHGAAQLYVELRRRGVPVNPLPWLAAGQDKVRG